MNLSDNEIRFLTALAREQNQTGCRGPAHNLLRLRVYPDAPRAGPGSIAFSYEAVPLIGALLKEFRDLQEIDDFLRKGEQEPEPAWPWKSPEEYRSRLQQALNETAHDSNSVSH
jgi:hypothetical protein